VSNTLNFNGAEQKLHTTSYNLEGLMMSKNLGINGQNPLQSIDYKYNNRGWLRGINQDISTFANGVAIPSCDPVNTTLDTDPVDALTEYTVMLSQLLDMRFDVEISSTSHEECIENTCELPSGCSSSDIIPQLTSVENIISNMETFFSTTLDSECIIDGVVSATTDNVISTENLPYSFNIVRIHLCNGLEYYVLEEYLDQITGDYYIQQTITVYNPDQLFEVDQGGNSVTIDLSQFLDEILYSQYPDGISMNVDAYNPCGGINCTSYYGECTLEETQQQQTALIALQENYETIDLETLSYPVTLYYVGICNGQTFWVLGAEIGFLSNTNYEVIDELILTGPETEIPIDDPITEVDKEDMFCLQLDYDPAGNIKKQIWQVAGRQVFTYDYLYDPLYRITNAEFSEHYNSDGSDVMTINNRFGVGGITRCLKFATSNPY